MVDNLLQYSPGLTYDFDLMVFENDDGHPTGFPIDPVPGTAIAHREVTVTGQESIINVACYSATFDPIILNGGTTYWLVIAARGDFTWQIDNLPGTCWVWLSHDQVGNSHAGGTNILDEVWYDRVRQNAFSLLDKAIEAKPVCPNSYQVFRGMEISGSLSDFCDSDDFRASYQPGFVLSSAEAPVWLVFDGGTGATRLTMYVIGTQGESFNADLISNFPIVAADHINANGDIRSRVGWRKTGITINFPWEVRIDQVGWNQ